MAKRQKTSNDSTTLLALPDELVLLILKSLDMRDLLVVKASCRRLHELTNELMHPLRVMTWNVRKKCTERAKHGWDWDQRLPVVDAVIEREDPDVLLLQEDDVEMTADLMNTTALKKYHSFPNSENDLIKIEILGDNQLYNSKCTLSRYNDELCGIYWKRDGYKYVKGGCYQWVSQRTNWVNNLNWVLLQGKTPLLVCNTHLESGLAQSHREYNSKMVRQAIRILRKRHSIPFLVGGDFNTNKKGFDYKLLTGGELHSFQLGGNPTEDLTDVFTAWDEDCPDKRFDPVWDGVRSGGHNGSTYNDWSLVSWSTPNSNNLYEKRVAMKQGNIMTYREHTARGHERHIDHIYIGSQCRDAIRVLDVRVVTNITSEDIRKKGTPPCFCGALKLCKKAWSYEAKELCTCRHFGILGSDHFPLVANLKVHENLKSKLKSTL